MWGAFFPSWLVFCHINELNHLKGSNDCKRIVGVGLPQFSKKGVLNKLTTSHGTCFDTTSSFSV